MRHTLQHKHTMKTSLVTLALAMTALAATAETATIASPDGKTQVTINDDGGLLTYAITYDGKAMLLPSRLGLCTDMGDYSQALTITATDQQPMAYTYTMQGTKASTVDYTANVLNVTVSTTNAKRPMTIEMRVSNNNVAYRYHLMGAPYDGIYGHKDEPRRVTVTQETSSFMLPPQTTTFLCPQIDGNHQGWMSTKPSYEEEYKADDNMTTASRYGKGYTFPCLFHVADDGWVLISETGTSSAYCGTHLSDYNATTGYTIAFPDATENHGLGSVTPAMSLPAATPWRTITVGNTLAPIVETTIAYDVVDQLFAPSENYKPGRYTWSWLIWQDSSINMTDQKLFIDLAATMGYEYCLVDAYWDVTLGREKIAELSKYAQAKGVSLLLWYNSNGAANDAPQGPRNCMNTSIARQKEMAWMQSIGVKGIKVDFFGGDKQQTMQQYEDLLSDANRFGLQVVFHGCTLPRGWEKMYPNFVASEAVLASENVFFSEHHAQQEGFELTMHPFARNSVASMDWGGTIMNRYLSKDNKSRHRRYTSDTFEMAAAIMNQTPVQCIAMQPNNIDELLPFEIDFLKSVPTTWDETRFIEGYPTKLAIIARRHADQWYVTGLNGEAKAKTITISLPMFAGKEVVYYTDAAPKKGSTEALTPVKRTLKVDKNGNAKVTLQSLGGIIITEAQ